MEYYKPAVFGMSIIVMVRECIRERLVFDMAGFLC